MSQKSGGTAYPEESCLQAFPLSAWLRKTFPPTREATTDELISAIFPSRDVTAGLLLRLSSERSLSARETLTDAFVQTVQSNP